MLNIIFITLLFLVNLSNLDYFSLPKRKGGVWKAGQLNHSWVGCLNVDSLDSQNMDLGDCDLDPSFIPNSSGSVVSIHGTESAETQGF